MTQSQSFNNIFTSIAETVQIEFRFSSKSFRRFLSTEDKDSVIIIAANKEEIF